jgi:O-antigen ligase
MLAMVCFYVFLVIERPWESIRYLEGIPIERTFAVLLILCAALSGKLTVEKSQTNFWVYGLLSLHFLLAPFSYSFDYAVDAGIEYAKMVVLYLLMLSVARDEESLKLLVKAFVITMFVYMSHSLWEYSNGRHVWRMGISRMVGVDQTYSDPNAFGASVVLSLPFVYALLRAETNPLLRKLYLVHFALAVVCVVLTGSRSASIALVALFLGWALTQKGIRKIGILALVIFALGTTWTVMPEEKRERIMTLWDEEAGPDSAHQSADGRLWGWRVSWEMFKQQPFTGVGPGGKNYIEYRVDNRVDVLLGGLPSPTQSHILYGEVLAKFGVFGAFLFAGLVLATWNQSRKVKKYFAVDPANSNFFLYSLAQAITAALLLLLLLGLGGHNFYRPLWLWLAAWSGSLAYIVELRSNITPDGIVNTNDNSATLKTT